MSGQFGYQGAQNPSSATSEYNTHAFVIRQILNQISTATLVQIKAVTNSGGIAPVGFVDVLPLVNQIDGGNGAMPHGVVHNIPYFRLQGGANAIILDPQVGDIGICVFADRDISAVKTAKGVANPGSKRRFDMADGLYIGGVINGTPNQYIAFSSTGISMVSPTHISMAAPTIVLQATQTIGLTAGTEITNSAPTVEIDGTMAQGNGPNGGTASMVGPLTVTNDVTAQGKSVHNHTHTAQGATAVTTPPN
jgi:hypothetical protein